MEQPNMKNKIQSIKELFKNIRDTLSHDEKWEIRSKIYRNEGLYNYYTKKNILNKKQRKSFNEAVDNLNELYENLLKKKQEMKIMLYTYQINYLMIVNII